MPRKKPPVKLPKHVHLKREQWYVGINFPTGERNAAGKIIYDQSSRRCFPETAERAAELAVEIAQSYEANSQLAPGGDHQTLNQYLQVFISAKRRSLARRTFEFYTEQFDWHVKESKFGQLRPDAIKPLDVQKFYDSRLEAGASSDAVRKLHQFLSAAFNQAVLWETLPKNPAKGVILPKKQKPATAAMTAAEARTFLEICRQSEKHIVFEFALETAMRPEEYLALTWNDIDLENNLAFVRRAVAVGFAGGGFEFKDTKTIGSNRVISFSEQVAARLQTHRALKERTIEDLEKKIESAARVKRPKTARELRSAARLRFNAEKIKNYREFNLVFPSSTGGPQSRLNLNRREFKRILNKAELDEKKFSLYSLRRTTATLLASKLNPKELAAFMGHTDVQTSLKFYVLITDDSKYKAINALSEMFYGGK